MAVLPRTLLDLSDEKMQKIFTDREFLVKVAKAGKCYDEYVNFKYFKTCDFPVEYRVTEAQIETAKVEMDRQIKEELFQLKTNNCLMFVGLGMNYESTFVGDVCNHRIRTYFRNKRGRGFMVEFGHGGGRMHCNYSIDTDLEMQRKTEPFSSRKQDYYNFAQLQTKQDLGSYTLQNVLEVVNSNFGTNFKTIEVNGDILRGEKFECVSI